MYLKRITITGFKSFASKTVLELGPGMTAVVGPNGSGKSNVADAIRWALGEQNKSRLRLGDREEVVFAGTERRARASMAEVVLLFDNQDRAFGLDLTEVEISRRLYRSGETEYRLAGRSVKLGDLQQLLADAGFGVGSYAVIGQGTIDSLLLSSPSERKMLFDEAAGIRGIELGREAAMRKLAATEANLVRLRDINAELAPRAASLERATTAAKEEDQLRRKVTDLRATIVATAKLQLGEGQQRAGQDAHKLLARHSTLADEITELERDQAEQRTAAKAQELVQAQRARDIRQLEGARDQAVSATVAARAELAAARQAVADESELAAEAARLEKARAKLAAEQTETTQELASLGTQATRAGAALVAASTKVAAAQAALIAVRQQLSDGTRQQYVGHALGLIRVMARQLDDTTIDVDELRLVVHKTGRLLSHASRTGEAELAASLKAAQGVLEAAMAARETAAEHQSNLVLSRRSLELETEGQAVQAHQLERDETALHGRQTARVAAASHARQLADALAAAEQRQAEVTAALADARASAAPATASAEAVAALAIKLERARSEHVTVGQQLATARQLEASLATQAAAYAERAQAWGVVEPGHPSRTPLAELDQTLVRLEAELETRIQLGLGLKAEYAEVTSRQQELALQMTDLEAASSDLTALIERLSVTVQERFKTNFAALSREFARQAHRLFNGGSASLELTEDDSGQYGIAIKVSPRGKRLGSLAALSGGERALAGVALLAAILAVNPSPFVVLDEIDAALDDANSGRLADIMGELADRAQLIVITHNRQTMKAARVLFGVTMDQNHVSTLLSLHLEEATSLAAR